MGGVFVIYRIDDCVRKGCTVRGFLCLILSVSCASNLQDIDEDEVRVPQV